MEAAVHAVNLSKTYGTGSAVVRALDHVSLTIARGTVAALLGPSGSGKLALIALIAIPTLWALGHLNSAIATMLFIAMLAIQAVCIDLPVVDTGYRALGRLWHKPEPSKAKK